MLVFSVFFLIAILIFIFLHRAEGYDSYKALHIVTDILQQACDVLGLRYTITNNNTIKIENKNKSVEFYKLYNNLHTEKQKLNATYKPLTSKLLSQHNLPVPKSIVFKKPTHVTDIQHIIQHNTIQFPIVVKPVDGTGGKNVFVNIKNNKQLTDILKHVFLRTAITKVNKIMLEEYIKIASVPHSDHRILCYKNNILDIVQRDPPYVVGDGKTAITELVTRANRKKTKLCHHLIKIDFIYLKKKGLRGDSILNDNVKLIVNPISNFHQGGVLKRIPLELIHPDNVSMLKNINSYLGLQLCGIDFLITDITKSYKTQICGINEVNSSPNFDIHYYANIKNGLQIPIKFLQLYFNMTPAMNYERDLGGGACAKCR